MQVHRGSDLEVGWAGQQSARAGYVRAVPTRWQVSLISAVSTGPDIGPQLTLNHDELVCGGAATPFTDGDRCGSQ